MEMSAVQNTDREIYRATPGDYYSPSIHVTERGGIGINVGGTVIVKPLEGWHQQAAALLHANEALSAQAAQLAAVEAKLNQAEGVIMMREATIEQVRDLADHDADRLREQLTDAQATIQRLTEEHTRQTGEAMKAMGYLDAKLIDALRRLAMLEGALKDCLLSLKLACGSGHPSIAKYETALAPAPGGHIGDANKMVWAKGKPTGTGEYWFLGPQRGVQPFMVDVVQDGDCLWGQWFTKRGHIHGRYIEHMDGEWCGPLHAPGQEWGGR